MNKIEFVNNQAPALSAENLNQMQDNMEDAINEGIEESTYASNTYSTTETRIGTWIDGKPIYRKVYTINLSASDRSTTITIPNSIISNVKEIIAINGMVKGTYGFFPIYYANPNGSVTDGIGIYYGLSVGLRINMGAISLDSNSNVRVTIEYNKTTD